MIEKRLRKIFIFIHILSIFGIALIIFNIDMFFLHKKLNEYDNRVFNEIVEKSSKSIGVEELMSELDNLILDKDVIILYDQKSQKVIKSINLVTGEKYQDSINKLVEIDEDKIKLNRSITEISKRTYVNDFSVKFDELFEMYYKDNTIVYYIPKWRTKDDPYIFGVLILFTITCFFLAITVHIIEKILIIKK